MADKDWISSRDISHPALGASGPEPVDVSSGSRWSPAFVACRFQCLDPVGVSGCSHWRSARGSRGFQCLLGSRHVRLLSL